MILHGENASLLEDLYQKYKQDPQSVDREWAAYFQGLEDGGRNGAGPGVAASNGDVEYVQKQVGVQSLIESYRRFGHMAANLDPLGLRSPERELLELELYGLSEDSDLEREFESGVPELGRASLRKIREWMESTYCGSIGVEYGHIRNTEERDWLQKTMESTANAWELDAGTRRRLYEKLFQAEHFEKFLAQKFIGKKRFSLEGGETLIPAMDAIVEEAGEHGAESIVIGMAHRGRLNILVNIMEKPAGVIFAEFKEKYDPDSLDYADVKYHLGYSQTRTTRSGKDVHLSLAFNPSHLEAANPVVMGSVRARQTYHGDTERKKIMPLLIHGDAAFMGQGVVAECLNLKGLDGYSVGGTFHIVCNNQIGFTTLPSESRSTRYATDLARGFQIPVFHVNADDPEAVFRVVRLAMEYRQRYGKDVIIDLICYRRLGHNEMDEPAFTQPLMYEVIKKHPTTAELYRKKLADDPDIEESDLEFIERGSRDGLEESFKRAEEEDVRMKVDTMRGRWSEFSMEPLDSEPQTRLLREQLDRIYQALTNLPEGFTPHKTLGRGIEARKKMYNGEQPIDWAFAEALALGSILENGYRVRLAGQDSQRGTFSHRHAVLNDVKTAETYTPLNHISSEQGRLEVINSPLSEYACLGFEYGYSLADPMTLTIWEAQFGDFVNGAQITIDQFISSSEVKWRRLSGLVMLLPHGYEGQGPEHSSARLERFLQLCSRNNMQVCNCSTPAQYFHLLRRQMLRRTRKPLVIMTPKSLLRLAEAGSSLDDLGYGVFREVLHDKELEQTEDLRKVLFCSGKVYYDLRKAREEREIQDVAILRVEQLYPYPGREIQAALEKYRNAGEYIWVQEEPRNQGAWDFLDELLTAQLPEGKRLRCISREANPSPAAGLSVIHKQEQEQIVDEALG